jgi:dTDP-6-deoxy-L-talose 4-dehydrogenase (NAD+)
MKTKSVLITGATGFVGRQVLHHLSKQNVRVTLVLRESKQDALADHPIVETVIPTPDLFAETTTWWANTLQGIDTLIHIAWYTEPGLYLQSSKNMDCLQGTLNLAKGAADAGVRRFVGIGTCFEYDLSQGMLSVATLKPLTPYAGAKAASYLALTHWLDARSIEFVWCRLFYLYGQGEDARRLVPYLRAKLAAGEPAELTSGNQIRDFIDVAEAGRLIASAALGTSVGPINICSGTPITVKQLAEDIADEYGRRDLLKFGARPDNLIDPPCVIGTRNYYPC